MRFKSINIPWDNLKQCWNSFVYRMTYDSNVDDYSEKRKINPTTPTPTCKPINKSPRTLVLAQNIKQHFTKTQTPPPHPIYNNQYSYKNPYEDYNEKYNYEEFASKNKPFIGFWARMSQVWLNPYTIFLILMIIKIFMFNSSLQNSLQLAQRSTMNSCSSAESMASKALASPHLVAQGANSLMVQSVSFGIQALITVLQLLMFILEELIFFIINMVLGTFACLLTVAVESVANTALDAAEDVISFTNKTINAVLDGAEKGLDGIETAVNGVGDVLNDVSNFFTGNKNGDPIKDVNLSLGKLRNITIPASVTEKIDKIRDKVPNYDDVKNATRYVISLPFGEIKEALNRTVTNARIEFNSSAVTLPPQPSVQFCTPMDEYDGVTAIESFYTNLQSGISQVAKVFIIILALCAVIVCVPTIVQEFRSWLWVKSCAQFAVDDEIALQKAAVKTARSKDTMFPNFSSPRKHSPGQLGFTTSPEFRNPNFQHSDSIKTTMSFDSPQATNRQAKLVEIIQRASHHIISIMQDFVANRFVDPRKKLLARWWVEYIFYTPALAVLLLGLCGVILVIIQTIIFNKVVDAYHDVLDAGSSSNNAGDGNNITFWAAASEQSQMAAYDVQKGIEGWVDSTNTEMHRVELEINEKLLGWIHRTSEAMNESIGEFSYSMNKQLNDTFGDTFLYDGVKGIVQCVIGNKIDAVQKAFEWVHNNSAITLPNVTSEMILNVTETSSSTNPTAAPATTEESKFDSILNDAKDILNSGIRFIIDFYQGCLDQELSISLALVGVWLFVVLIGLLYCIYRFKREEKNCSGEPHSPNEVSGRFRKLMLASKTQTNSRTAATDYRGEDLQRGVIGKTATANQEPISPTPNRHNTTKSSTLVSKNITNIPGLGQFEYLNHEVDEHDEEAKKPRFSLSSLFIPKLIPPRPLKHSKVNQHNIPLSVAISSSTGIAGSSETVPVTPPPIPPRVPPFTVLRKPSPPDFRSFPYPSGSPTKDNITNRGVNQQSPFSPDTSTITDDDTLLSIDRDWHIKNCPNRDPSLCSKGINCSAGKRAPALLNTPLNSNTNPFLKSSYSFSSLKPEENNDRENVSSPFDNFTSVCKYGVGVPRKPVLPAESSTENESALIATPTITSPPKAILKQQKRNLNKKSLHIRHNSPNSHLFRRQTIDSPILPSPSKFHCLKSPAKSVTGEEIVDSYASSRRGSSLVRSNTTGSMMHQQRKYSISSSHYSDNNNYQYQNTSPTIPVPKYHVNSDENYIVRYSNSEYNMLFNNVYTSSTGQQLYNNTKDNDIDNTIVQTPTEVTHVATKKPKMDVSPYRKSSCLSIHYNEI